MTDSKIAGSTTNGNVGIQSPSEFRYANKSELTELIKCVDKIQDATDEYGTALGGLGAQNAIIAGMTFIGSSDPILKYLKLLAVMKQTLQAELAQYDKLKTLQDLLIIQLNAKMPDSTCNRTALALFQVAATAQKTDAEMSNRGETSSGGEKR
jgi:hypothetical protein